MTTITLDLDGIARGIDPSLNPYSLNEFSNLPISFHISFTDGKLGFAGMTIEGLGSWGGAFSLDSQLNQGAQLVLDSNGAYSSVVVYGGVAQFIRADTVGGSFQPYLCPGIGVPCGWFITTSATVTTVPVPIVGGGISALLTLVVVFAVLAKRRIR